MRRKGGVFIEVPAPAARVALGIPLSYFSLDADRVSGRQGGGVDSWARVLVFERRHNNLATIAEDGPG